MTHGRTPLADPRQAWDHGPRRLVMGISGATGIVLGARVLELAAEAGVETHLVVSRAAEQSRAAETDLTAEALRKLASVAYRIADIGAAIASGSYPTIGMIVAPCSARTLAAIAHGTGDNLLTRAADVTLKERRLLVLAVRETPLSLVHARAILAATEAGAVVAPPVPAFYLRPSSIDELVTHTAGRLLDLVGIEASQPRWGIPDTYRPLREPER